MKCGFFKVTISKLLINLSIDLFSFLCRILQKQIQRLIIQNTDKKSFLSSKLKFSQGLSKFFCMFVASIMTQKFTEV